MDNALSRAKREAQTSTQSDLFIICVLISDIFHLD